MNRQTRTFIVLAVAVVAASVASFGVYRAIASIPVRNVEIATRHAVVAAKAMPTGSLLGADAVKVVPWPANTPLAGGFTDVESVVDRGLTGTTVPRPTAPAAESNRLSGSG